MLRRSSGWLTVNVRTRRQLLGLTQEELAERVGVVPTYVARVEAARETVNVTLRVLSAFAVALGCKPHELLVPRAAPKPRPPGRPKISSQTA
jgi:transcriptional regulator with XRE-family HTH domain